MEQFSDFVSQLLGEDDIRLFGDNAAKLVGQALLYPAVFSPYPDTFDSEAFAYMVDDQVAEMGLDSTNPDRIDRLLNIARECGVVNVDENGRLYISPEVQEKILPLMDKYDQE